MLATLLAPRTVAPRPRDASRTRPGSPGAIRPFARGPWVPFARARSPQHAPRTSDQGAGRLVRRVRSQEPRPTRTRVAFGTPRDSFRARKQFAPGALLERIYRLFGFLWGNVQVPEKFSTGSHFPQNRIKGPSPGGLTLSSGKFSTGSHFSLFTVPLARNFYRPVDGSTFFIYNI